MNSVWDCKDKKGRKESEEVEEIGHLFDYLRMISHSYLYTSYPTKKHIITSLIKDLFDY